MKRLHLTPKNSNGPLHQIVGATRAGATLSEALVALLVMAIGVISLASLFPIAVLKTAKANQLTTATDIRYNAEAMMKVYPWIFADPNPADTGGPLGVADGLPFNDYDFTAGGPFAFDPLATIPGRPVAMPVALGLLPRYGGGFDVTPAGTAEAADGICSGPDTWVLAHDNTITGMNAALTQMTVTDLVTTQLPSIQPAPPAGVVSGSGQSRVQIFYNGGKSSLTRKITGFVAPNTVVWTEDVNGNNTLDPGEDQNRNGVLDPHALPTGITYETARVETRERRYSWMLTVRPQDDAASFTGGLGAKPGFDVSVVVFFGRSFSLEDERVYGTLPVMVPPLPPVPNLAAGSTVTLNEGRTDFTLTWAPGDTPVLKRGGWILDAQNGYWYQIDNYTDTTGAASSLVRLISPIIETSTLIAAPRGVVDVFPIAPQTP